MGLFEGVNLNDTKLGGGFGGGIYFEDVVLADGARIPGVYSVEVETVEMVPTRDKTLMFCFHTKIVESNHPQRPAGSRCSYKITFGGKTRDVAPVQTKAALVASSGLNRQDPRHAKAIELIDWDNEVLPVAVKEQTFEGRKLTITATRRNNKAGGQYTRVDFAPAEPPIEGLLESVLKEGAA